MPRLNDLRWMRSTRASLRVGKPNCDRLVFRSIQDVSLVDPQNSATPAKPASGRGQGRVPIAEMLPGLRTVAFAGKTKEGDAALN